MFQILGGHERRLYPHQEQQPDRNYDSGRMEHSPGRVAGSSDTAIQGPRLLVQDTSEETVPGQPGRQISNLRDKLNVLRAPSCDLRALLEDLPDSQEEDSKKKRTEIPDN